MRAALLQAAGILLVAFGAGLFAVPLGFVIGGLGMLAFGLALERRQ